MRLRIGNQKGGALIMVLVITTLIGSVLVAYLSMLKSQNLYATRSLAWNTAMPMAEAGIEEALAHINYSGTTNLGSDGWTKTNNQYVFDRPITNGYAHITVSTDTSPFIVSIGYVKAPLQNTYISRTVRAGTRKRSPFQAGFTAKGTVTMSGGNMDSFDSADPLHSLAGLYDPLTRKANGKIQTGSGAAGALSLGNASVYGKVSTGPGGTVSLGANGEVGDIAWVNNSANKGTIEPGYSASDVNLSLEDVGAPFTNGYTPLSLGITNLYNGTNYDYKLVTGNYGATSFNMVLSQKMVVTSNAVLYVTGTFQISGQAMIYIPPGGNLKLYIGGNADIAGGAVLNAGGNATNLSIYCLGTCTTMTYAGNSAFIGTIYAPQTDVTLTGTSDGFGAIVGKTIATGGNMNFHYDEALGGGASKYIVVSWIEL